LVAVFLEVAADLGGVVVCPSGVWATRNTVPAIRIGMRIVFRKRFS